MAKQQAAKAMKEAQKFPAKKPGVSGDTQKPRKALALKKGK